MVGVEIAPGAEYFEELWVPLVCFCYGAAAMYVEMKSGKEQETSDRFSAIDLGELREELKESRREVMEDVQTMMEKTPKESFDRQEEERLLSMRLDTVTGKNFAGQIVEDDDRLVYASIAARYGYLFDGA